MRAGVVCLPLYLPNETAGRQDNMSKSLLALSPLRMIKDIVVRVAPNIALIKYWGKRDEDLILPCNSSLSCTLDRTDLASRTRIRCRAAIHSGNPNDMQDHFTLNGVAEAMPARMQRMLAEWRRSHPHPPPGLPAHVPFYFDIVSVNERLPTAAGLASSSSGYSALGLYATANAPSSRTAAFALARLYEEPDIPDARRELSRLARFVPPGLSALCASCLP